MKIAAVSETGVTIEGRKIVAHEKLDKMGHNQFGGETHEEAHWAHSRGRGFDPAVQNRHARMVVAEVLE